ncbi:uncharacterized protein BDFB_004795, partial [Asbolus verrucosus]
PNEESCGTKTLEGSKLKCPAPISRLRVEKIEGGLMVAGVVVAANCQIILPIFGFLFLLLHLTEGQEKTKSPTTMQQGLRLRLLSKKVVAPACYVGLEKEALELWQSVHRSVLTVKFLARGVL